MIIINKDHWAYKLWLNDSKIIHEIMSDKISVYINHPFPDKFPEKLRYIYLTTKGNIYIFIRNKKSLEIMKEEQGEPLIGIIHTNKVPVNYELIVTKGEKICVKKIDKYQDYEIYDAIVDNQIVPMKYFSLIKEHISKLSNMEEIFEFLKYIKNEINQKNNFKEEIKKDLNQCKEEIKKDLNEYKEQIEKDLNQFKEEIEKYKKIESFIKKNYPHLSKYFVSNIDLIINEEKEEIMQVRKNLAEKIDKLKSHEIP